MRMLAMLCLVLPIVAGAETHTVSVVLDDNGCPIETVPDDLDLAPGDRVIWQAIDSFGDVGKEYSIRFDPFSGGAFKSDRFGIARSTPVDRDMNDIGVAYKYTVVSEDGCPPLDPRLRVGRGGG